MYHVGVSNIFELLDDENDEGGKREVPRVAVNQEAAATKGTKTSAPVNRDQPRKTDAPAKGQFGRNDRSDNRTERKPRQEGGERAPRTDRPRREGDRPRRDGDRPTSDKPRENREPREPREPRQPRDDAPFDRTEKRRDGKEREHGQFVKSQTGHDGAPRKMRIYDRKSGTGRGKEVKRGGGGAGNWGTQNGDGKWDAKPVAEDIAKIEGEAVEEPAQVVPQETEEQKKAREDEEKRIKEEEEKEAKLMGLEDYHKKKAEERAKLPELRSVRQAGEGVDKKELQKWASYTPLSKKDEDEDAKQLDAKKKEKKEAKKQSVSADLLNFQAKKPERPERRDNKNSPKFNKDSNKKKRTGPAAPDVKDSSNFPALSTKA